MHSTEFLKVSAVALVLALGAGQALAAESAASAAAATATAAAGAPAPTTRPASTAALPGARAAARDEETAVKRRLNELCAARADVLDCRREAIDDLADGFRGRARDRQRQADIASWFSAVSTTALVIGVSGGAAATTQAAWSFGAASPLLMNDLRASDHRGMLHMTVARALDTVSERYGRLDESIGALETLTPKVTSDDIADRCGGLRVALGHLRAVKDDSRRTTVLSAVEAMIVRCDAAADASRQLTTYRALAGLERKRLKGRLADDAQTVVTRAVELDRALGATPVEAVRTAAATPFLTLGNLLKGGDTAFNGRQDPRVGETYELQLSAFVGPATIPEAVATDGLLPAGATQAMQEIAAGLPAKASKAAPLARPVFEKEVVDLVIRSASELPDWAGQLNRERLAALRVAAADGESRISLDPRRPAPESK